MTDRELLELAAKAAGIKTSPHKETDSLWIDWPRVWNPLTYDGDALRLYEDGVAHGTDPYAATRRAIVQAAAELGKGMK